MTLWEILTLARDHPYDELTDEQIIENITFQYQHGQLKVGELLLCFSLLFCMHYIIHFQVFLACSRSPY